MSPTPYRNVLSSAQRKMSASIAQIWAAHPHSGETGDLIERVFRSQLLEALPEKIGVSSGFVLDSHGSVSRQMDIILYDRPNTPRIFASDGAQMFPVETTCACGEIKTSMDSTQLIDTFEKCLSYRRSDRKAYYSQSHRPLQTTHTLFGCNYEHWQSTFSCIAAESASAAALLPKFNEIVEQHSLKIHERVDTFVALDATDNQNILLNSLVEAGTDIPQDKSIDLLPAPSNRIRTFRATEPWSLFVMLLLRYMIQVPTEPVKMLLYSGNDPF